MPAKKPHHCWHRKGLGISSAAGSTYHEICCWCGAARTVQTAEKPDEGHGPHFTPLHTVTTYQGGDQACVKRSKAAKG